MKKLILALLLIACTPAAAQWQTPNHSVPVGRGAGVTGFGSAVPGTAGIPLISQGGVTDPAFAPLNLGGAGATGTVLPANGGTGLDNSVNVANDVLASNGPNGSFLHTALISLINTVCTASPSTCNSVFGYSNVLWYGAKCDGVTDDKVALQAWANALGSVGNGIAPSASGACATSAPILFQATLNVAPTQGPHIIGNLKLLGLNGLGATFTGTGSGTNLTTTAVVGNIRVGDFISGVGVPIQTSIVSQTSGPAGGAGVYVTSNATTSVAAAVTAVSDVLRIWNPTAVSTTQNFYYAQFDSIEVSMPGVTTANCVSVRGFWGRIGQIFGRGCGADVLQFPYFTFAGTGDEYENNPTIGEVTGIDTGGYVVDNQIGNDTTARFSNIRGTITANFNLGLGAANLGGNEQINGGISYTGGGWAVSISKTAAFAGRPHEIFTQGQGDIDCAQNGVRILEGERMLYSGHRINIDAPGFCGVGSPSLPATAYSFGKAGGGAGLLATEINAYVSIRPGVTAGNIGTLFDFNNDFNINGLTVNVQFVDGAGIIGTTMLFANIYKNINASSAIRIVQNGLVVYDTINVAVPFASLPPCTSGMNGVTRTVNDSNTAVFRAAIAGGAANVVKAACISGQWLVD